MRKRKVRRGAALLMAALLLGGLFPLRTLAENGTEEMPEELLRAVADSPEETITPAETLEMLPEESTEELPEESAVLASLTAETPVPAFSLHIALSSIYESGSVLLQTAGESYAGAVVFDPTSTGCTLPDTFDSFKSLVFETAFGAEGTAELRYRSGSELKVKTLPAGKTTVPLLQVGVNFFSVVLTENAQSREYCFSVRVLPTLTALSLSSGTELLTPEPAFAPRQSSYSVSLPAETENVTVSATPKGSDYSLLYNDGESASVNVSGQDSLKVSVLAAGLRHDYSFSLKRVLRNTLRVSVSPAEAVVKLYDKTGTELTENGDGSYFADFSDGLHTYTACCYGYISQSGVVPASGGELTISLEKAQESGKSDVGADWGSFRSSDSNMGITDLPLPTEEDAESVGLLWNRKLGEGWQNAPSVQIIVDHALVVLCGTGIYKLDLRTGETLQQGEMAAAPNWGYTPPTYAEGLIFAPLTGGVIQAFDARTLESVWVYHDPLGGQSLSPITYAGGYIYSGFWTGEDTVGNYVCLSVTDENPSRGDEEKHAVWRYGVPGGYYWAGSVIVGSAVIMGTGDGQSTRGSSRLLSLNRYTGRLISSLTLTDMGDQRASVAYEAASGRVYFTTQAGFFCSAAVEASTGKLSDLRCQASSGRQATSTPVIYGGRAYYGVGSGISSSGSTGEFVVARADTLETLYTVPLRGYPQCSQLLSTAHLSEGYLYFYTTYNSKPGGITLIRIDPSADSAAGAQTYELYNAEGFEEYCIASLICGADGTIYYKNDSGSVLAVGIPTDESVTRLIEAITEPVTIEQESAVLAARSAYDKLTPAAKSRISGYEKLLSAEAAIRSIREKIAAVEEKIAAIGVVTFDDACKARIAEARAAYEALTRGERAEVENYPTLTAAERKYDSLKGTGTTRAISEKDKDAVTVTIGGVKYTVHRSAGELMQRIEKLTADSPKEDILTVRGDYEALSSELKAQVFNYPELEALCDAISVRAHRDDFTGLHAVGLGWNQKLTVLPLQSGEAFERLNGGVSTLRGDSLLGTWKVDISLLSETAAFGIVEEYTLCIPLRGVEETAKLYLHWLDGNGGVQVSECRREAGCALVTVCGSGAAALVAENAAVLPELEDEPVLETNSEGESAMNARMRRLTTRQGVFIVLAGLALLEGLFLLRCRTENIKTRRRTPRT